MLCKQTKRGRQFIGHLDYLSLSGEQPRRASLSDHCVDSPVHLLCLFHSTRMTRPHRTSPTARNHNIQASTLLVNTPAHPSSAINISRLLQLLDNDKSPNNLLLIS
jgi:hypothetical protein